jgi:polyhydroxybutyrate depolymerase
MLPLRAAAAAAFALAVNPCAGFGPGGTAPVARNPLVVARPFRLDAPIFYDPKTPAPLLLVLHGYGGDAAVCGADAWLVSAIARTHGAFVACPNGTLDVTAHRFWNATDSCCNFGALPVDDVTYLSAVIDDVALRYRVDPKRVWVAGISNGGFTAHRLACERAGKIAAIVSFGGAGWSDAARCSPVAPVSVLEVHGADDDIVPYDGSATLLEHDVPPYPSVGRTVADSAVKAGCRGALASEGTREGFDAGHPDAKTEIAHFTGCPSGIDVERWRMTHAKHVIDTTRAWSEAVLAWLERHAKR